MRLQAARFGSLFLYAWLAFGVDGTVVNGTSGKPQAGVEITYMQFGEAGMQPAGAARTDSGGRFRIDAAARGPSMLQAVFDGVTYNKMLPPGSPTTGVSLQVFDASPSAPEAKVAQHMVLLEPADKLSVSETFIYENKGKVTMRDPAGATFRFYLPAAAGGIVRVRATAEQGMPVDRVARETAEKNVYGVDYAIRPGETRFDLSYELPAASHLKFESRILHDGTTRLVAPSGVKFTGSGLEALGQEPTTQATVYGVTAKQFAIVIDGTGTLKAPGAAAPDESENTIKESLPRIYQRRDWIIGLTILILTIGLVLLYRSGERQG